MKKYDFNSDWVYKGMNITLPHDSMITEARRKDAESGGGCAYFVGGVYEYEKTFTAPLEWAEKDISLQFEGVYRNAKVYVNGVEAGGAAYGYIPFFVTLTNLKYGEENTVKVVADNSKQPNSRWYSGGGIYRPVWLWECEKEGLTCECIKITTLSYAPAQIKVQSIDGAKVEIIDNGKVIASGEGAEIKIDIPEAMLWSDESPYLYSCRVSVGKDMAEEKFGIRKMEWSNKGLFVNGQETLLRGGCIHHDNGILGAATYEESEWRRVRLLKEAGYNALRISHNPASTAILEACDYYGMYVIDEMWDMWYSLKSKYDYAKDFMANYKKDIEAVVNRDFNHPSVIMYSIGNEVSEPSSSKGVELAKEMIGLFHILDSSRPVTAGMNLMIISRAAKGNAVYTEDGEGGANADAEKMQGMNSLMFNMITNIIGSSMNKAANSKKADEITTPVLDALDIAGYNYASGRYPLEGKAHPERIIFGSETFPQDLYKNWKMVKKYPYLIGDFMWTAWDYLGESGAGAWAYSADGKGFQKPYPWLLADMGAMDILGNSNGELFWAQAVWGLLEQPKMAVRPVNHPGVRPVKSSWRGTNAIPCWSWSKCEGNKAIVEVYFDCAYAELYLNNKKIGKKKAKECRVIFKTKYQSGKLEAVCFDHSGKELGRCTLSTINANEINVSFEKKEAYSGEILYVPVHIGDGDEVQGNSDRMLTVTVDGGELLGFGSANPRTEERYHTGSFTTYYGRAQAIVRAGNSGNVKVKVSDGEKEGIDEIAIK